MPNLTEENIRRIVRLNEIAEELRTKKITVAEANRQVQEILDIFNEQDGIPSRATPYERSIEDRLARHDRKMKIDGILLSTGNEADNLRAMHWTDIASQYDLTDEEAKYVYEQLR